MSIQAILSIGELNLLVRQTLERNLPICWVSGEISNFTRAASGHWYFTLKDSSASIRCVMFRTRAQFVDWSPRDGNHVEVRAQPTLYEPRGDLQLVVDAMRPVGRGRLYEAFLEIKARLEREGLFDPARKRPIPKYPTHIGILTSERGAALWDTLKTLGSRWPSATLVLYPTPVQGMEAISRIPQALRAAEQHGLCQMLLIVRGGGSLEDLQAFNDEQVARAIAASPIPTIAGIGHETDFTIVDFVVDARGPTPTGAAQLASPELGEVTRLIANLNGRLKQSTMRRIELATQQLDSWSMRLPHPDERLDRQRRHLGFTTLRMRSALGTRISRSQAIASRLIQRVRGPDVLQLNSNLSRLERKLADSWHRTTSTCHQRLQSLESSLAHLNPASVLARGYGLIRDSHGHIITSENDVAISDIVTITLADGILDARIIGKMADRQCTHQ